MKKSGVAGVQELQNETAAFRPVDGVTYTEGHEGHKEMGDQLGGSVKYSVARFWTCHAGSRRSASRLQGRVARCDMGLPATPVISVGVRGPQAGRFAPMDFADLASTPLQSSGLPTPRPLWLWLRRVVSLCPCTACLFTNPRKRRLQPLPA